MSPMEDLLSGNARFREKNAAEITKHAEGQKPKQMCICCMDSRAVPHLVFDQPLGTMFAQTNAGNVVTETFRGGAAYAVLHGINEIDVVGHTRCGAISATFDWIAKGKEIADPDIKAIANLLKPAVEEAVKQLKAGKLETEEQAKDLASRINVKNQMRSLMRNETVRKKVESGEVKIYGGLYDIKSGKLEKIAEREKAHRKLVSA